MSEVENLATLLSRAIEARNVSLDTLVERTKVTKPTLRAFLGATDPAVLPSRVYLRGHLRIVANYLAVDEAQALASFDRAFPVESDSASSATGPRMSRASVAFVAGLAGLGVLAIVLSIVAT